MKKQQLSTLTKEEQIRAKEREALLSKKYASKEEYWYSVWLDILIDNGYIESYEYQIPFIVINEKQLTPYWNKPIPSLTYTADFKIVWNKDKAHRIFFVTEHDSTFVNNKNINCSCLHFATIIDNQYISYVDVKGKFAGINNNSALTFPIVQKALLAIHNIYVQKIVPFSARGLFNYTFIPNAFVITMKGEERKVLFKKRTLQEYVDSVTIVPTKTSKSKKTVAQNVLFDENHS